MQKNENTILKWMTFVTSFGDFFTLFALILLTQELFHDVTMSAYCAVIKSAALAVAGIFTPRILPGFKSKNIFIYSQLLSSLFIFLLCYLLKADLLHSAVPIYLVIFINTFLWQVFVAARESLSKAITTDKKDHRSNTAELLSGLLMAQTLGPLVALATIHYFGPLCALLVDASSFFLCALIGLKIHSHAQIEKGASLLRPFKYLPQKKLLKKIFLLRTLGYWVPTAIFNFLVFDIATQKFNGVLGNTSAILGSAVIYACCGFGAWFGNTLLRQNREIILKTGDGRIAFASQLLIACVFLLFLVPTWGAITICFLYFLQAVGMGGNALATQTIRRKLTTNTEFAELVSLEIVVGRALDWAVGTFTALSLKYMGMSTSALLIFAALWFAVCAKMHVVFDEQTDG